MASEVRCVILTAAALLRSEILHARLSGSSVGWIYAAEMRSDVFVALLLLPSQEPGSEAEIESFCSLNYGVSFPILAKVEVNGDEEHPVYKFLKSQKSGILGLKRIKWNFEKFLVQKDGLVFNRYSSLTKPEELKADIEKLLKA
jgi:hypothetical protein